MKPRIYTDKRRLKDDYPYASVFIWVFIFPFENLLIT